MQGNDQLNSRAHSVRTVDTGQPEQLSENVPGSLRGTPGAEFHSAEPRATPSKKSAGAQPFSEHVRELRTRFFFIVGTLFLGSIAGYLIHVQLFQIIRRPLHAQLYYTTPTGGFNAGIKISILFGIMLTIPVFVYQLVKFLSPAFRQRIGVVRVLFFSAILGILGALVAYFIALPAALHFLANIDSKNFEALITINEYMNFVGAYLVGFALLFQLPLILLFINRIKPQKPGKLMHVQRYVVLFSFILAAIFTPTPDPINQFIMAMPIILLYQFSVVLIWITNRRRRTTAEPALVTPAAAEYSADVYNAPTPVSSVAPQVPAPAPAPRPKLIMDIYWEPTKTPLSPPTGF